MHHQRKLSFQLSKNTESSKRGTIMMYFIKTKTYKVKEKFPYWNSAVFMAYERLLLMHGQTMWLTCYTSW